MMLFRNSCITDHLHTYVFLAEILHRLRDLRALAADDGDRAADRRILHDGNIGKDNVERNIEFTRYRRDQRLGNVALNVAQAHDELARLQLHHRRVLLDELLDLAEIGRRVDEAPGDLLPGICEHIEYLALLDDPAVLHDRHAVADLLDHGHFVRDDDDRDAELFVQVLQQPQDRLGGLGVERRGRLVAQQHIRVVCERPRDGNALLLSSGELLRVRLRLVSDADQLEQPVHLVRDLLSGKAAAAQRIRDISEHGARRHQIEVLKDHADLFARLPQLPRRERGHFFSVHRDRAGSWPLEQIDASHECGFAGAGEADDAEDLALADRKADVLHGVHRASAGGEIFGDMCQFYQNNSSLLHKKAESPQLPASGRPMIRNSARHQIRPRPSVPVSDRADSR